MGPHCTDRLHTNARHHLTCHVQHTSPSGCSTSGPENVPAYLQQGDGIEKHMNPH